ncbi:apoptosis facilitator Bcl-2-like protein 14 [Hemitrygon akajei]|uniref:apoptosis facilitator Bcl-2-like protein 14 n=1 Tax=Hemitrygon akajei TaxID=2704970 RepID=UPI003BF9767B
MGSSDSEESNSMSEYNSADDNCFEFRILMAYAERSLLADGRSKNKLALSAMDKREANQSSSKGDKLDPSHNVSPNGHRKDSTLIWSDEKQKKPVRKSKRKFKWKRWAPRCLRAETSKYDGKMYEESGGIDTARSHACEIDLPEPARDSEVNPHKVAEILQNVMNTTTSFRMLRSSSLEADGTEAEQKTIDQIVEFLTARGDSIDEKIKKDPQFAKLFSEKPTFSFFKKVMDYALQVALPEEINSEADCESKENLNKFAFVVHATTKFAVSGNHPMTRIMGFGTKYLQEKFTVWVKDKGGWENIIEEECID